VTRIKKNKLQDNGWLVFTANTRKKAVIDILNLELSKTYLELFRGFFSLSVDFFLSFFSLGSLTFLALGTFGIF